MEQILAVLALSVSALSVALSTYLYRRELDMADRHHLTELWNGVLDLAHQNPRYLDINVTENYRRAMREDERLRYDIYCHKAWGQVKAVVDRGYHTDPKFQVAIQWLVTFHYTWLEDNPGFFVGEEFWAAVDKGKSMPAVILRHRRMPTDECDEIAWDQVADEYHSLVLSPLNPVMTERLSTGGSRNPLVDELLARLDNSSTADPMEIADFGCGIGNLLKVLPAQAVKVVGIDISPHSLALAEKTARVVHISFESICDDLTTMRLGRNFKTIVSVNSLLPNEREELHLMLETVRAHLDESDGELLAILPSYDTTEYLQELWRKQYMQITGSADHALRVALSLRASKLVNEELLQYADDGFTRQCYHTPDSIKQEFSEHGLELVHEPMKVYYPWELARKFDYGYFPDAPEEIWDWFVIARAL